MPVDTQEIIDAASKVGDMVAQHPAVARYRDAQRAVVQDPDASRLLREFDRQVDTLSRQEATGMPITDAQRQQLEGIQNQIVSHLKIKNLNMAQVEFVDLLRRVSQTIQSRVNVGQGQGAGPQGGAGQQAPPPGPRLAT